MIRSTYWGPALADSQYAVFHFDVKTMPLRDPQGNAVSSDNDAPLVFDSLTGAENYCREKIATTPALGCRIYDHQGRVVRSFVFGVLLGVRFLWAGASKTIDGIAGLRAARAR